MRTSRPPSDPSHPEPLFKGLADQIQQLQRAVSDQEGRFGAVMEIGRAIGSTLDLDELLELVMTKVTLLMAAERSTLYLVDDATGELWSKVAQGEKAREIRLPKGRGLAGWVAENGKPLNLLDVYADERFNPEVDRLTGFQTRTLVAVPMFSKGGKVLGVVQALNRRDGPFSEDDLSLLEALAGQASVAVENALLYRETRLQNQKLEQTQGELKQVVGELDVLFDIEKRISAATTMMALLDAIVAKAMELTKSDAGSLLLMNEDEGGDLYFKAALGERGDDVKRLTLSAGEGIAGWVAHDGQPVIANDVHKHKAYDPRIAKRVNYKPTSVICVPVSLEGEIIGVLEMLNKQKGAEYNQADLKLLTLIAGQAARAITLGKSREEEQRKARLAMIGQMMSSVVHDLRTPMTIISGYAQLMSEEDDAMERQKSCNVILKQFDSINAMIQETLSFAKGGLSILKRRVHLNTFLQEISDYLSKDFTGKQIELKLSATYKGAVKMDENKMKRLIYNIARNAAQAMPDGGKFTIATEVEEVTRFVVFKFSDTGVGIAPEVADKLFGSFVSYGKRDGTGLGLAMVKKIAEEHGGDVSFKSKPGKGTTFIVRIPGEVP
jgi:signal transduction histidine kinase